MICPKCQAADDSKVTDTRPVLKRSQIRRRRECLYCGYRWTTREIHIDTLVDTILEDVVDSMLNEAREKIRQKIKIDWSV